MSNLRQKYAVTHLSRGQALQTLLAPVVTEKSMQDAAFNKVWFRVPVTASKPQVALAVKTLYDVKPVAVNTKLQKGKTKRFRGKLVRRPDTKVAVVTLPEGKTIDVSTGV